MFVYYTSSENPPILHRKETFVSSDYPNYKKFKQFTKKEEELGLLKNPITIGTKKGWEERLSNYHITITKHKIVS